MSTKGRLLTVVAGGGRRESLRHEVRGVGQDGGQALGVEIIALARTELKALAKRRALQGDENGVQFFHSGTLVLIHDHRAELAHAANRTLHPVFQTRDRPR